MNLKLVKASKEYEKQIVEMLEEWVNYNKHNETDQSPYAIFKNDYHDFDNYVNNLEVKESTISLVPDSTFFCIDLDTNEMVGAVNIRHYLNEKLLLDGGHIGDGVEELRYWIYL